MKKPKINILDWYIIKKYIGTYLFTILIAIAIIIIFDISEKIQKFVDHQAPIDGIIFETMPYIFAKMGAAAPWLSATIAILFFLTILVAALTSSISMVEAGVAYLTEEKGLTRRKAISILLPSTWALGVLCSLSFGPLADIHILGFTIFDFCDKLTSNYLMAFGGLLFTFFVAEKIAEIKGISIEDVSKITYENAKKIYNIKDVF